MFDAVFYLYNHHDFDYHPSQLQFPEPKSDNLQQLYQILSKMNIAVTPIIKDPHANSLSTSVPENAFFSRTKDAYILLQFQHDKNSLHHHNYFELNLVLQGNMTVTFTKEKMQLRKGSFIIISPFTPHQINVDQDSIVACITIRKSTFDQAFFSLLQNDDLISNFFKHNLYSSSQNYLLFSMRINYQVLETIQNIFIQAYSPSSQANVLCCNYISILLSYALEESINPKVLSSHTQRLTNRMTSIINLIKEKPTTITLLTLAQEFGYDKAYLGKLINKSTGHSFNYLRNYYRIHQACQLLNYTDQSIGTISRVVGYSSPNHFERCFKELMDLSPSNYRKK